MYRDDSPSDLYPPDSDDNSPEAKAVRKRAFWGTALVVFGVGLMLDRLLPGDQDYIVLAVGMGLIAGWTQVRKFGWFAWGAVLTGYGFGWFVNSLVGGAFGGALEALLAAVGWFAIFVRYPRRGGWAVIPAGISLVVAVASVGFGLAGLIAAQQAGVVLPGLLIAGGGLLLMRGRIPSRALKVALVVLAATFLLVASSSGVRAVLPIGERWIGHASAEVPLPSLEGKRLVIETVSGDVEVHHGESARVIATVRSRFLDSDDRPQRLLTHTDDVKAVENDGRVVIQAERQWRTASYEVTVPEGTDVSISTASGRVDGGVAGGDIEIDTKSGRVEFTTSAVDIGRLDVETMSGRVDLELAGKPAVHATSLSGRIEIDDDDYDNSASVDGPDGEVDVSTMSGRIEVDRQAS